MPSSRFALIAALLVITAACGSDYSAPPAAPSPTPAATPAPAPTPAPDSSPLSVAIPAGAEILGNRAYSPDQVNVAVGGTVTWTNTDSVAHTSTSDVSGWDSGIVRPGAQFSFAFQTAGTFHYHCAIHPGMVGTVVVQ